MDVATALKAIGQAAAPLLPAILATLAFIGLFFANKLFGHVYSTSGIEEKFGSMVARLFRQKRYSDWSLTPAGNDELDYVRLRLNHYLAESERHQDTERLKSLWSVLPGDILILRGPALGARQGRYGIAIMHPILASYGRQFQKGDITGRHLEPHMLSRARRSKYFYISFAEAYDSTLGKTVADAAPSPKDARRLKQLREILILKLGQQIYNCGQNEVVVLTRPTTAEALHLVTNRKFIRCSKAGGPPEIWKTCYLPIYFGPGQKTGAPAAGP